MTYAIRKVLKNGIRGYQVVRFNLNTYLCKNGYPADEVEVDGCFFEDRDEAEAEAMSLEMDEEYSQ